MTLYHPEEFGGEHEGAELGRVIFRLEEAREPVEQSRDGWYRGRGGTRHEEKQVEVNVVIQNIEN